MSSGNGAGPGPSRPPSPHLDTQGTGSFPASLSTADAYRLDAEYAYIEQAMIANHQMFMATISARLQRIDFLRSQSTLPRPGTGEGDETFSAATLPRPGTGEGDETFSATTLPRLGTGEGDETFSAALPPTPLLEASGVPALANAMRGVITPGDELTATTFSEIITPDGQQPSAAAAPLSRTPLEPLYPAAVPPEFTTPDDVQPRALSRTRCIGNSAPAVNDAISSHFTFIIHADNIDIDEPTTKQLGSSALPAATPQTHAKHSYELLIAKDPTGLRQFYAHRALVRPVCAKVPKKPGRYWSLPLPPLSHVHLT